MGIGNVSLVDKARAFGWRPAEELPEGQQEESARAFLRTRVTEAAASGQPVQALPQFTDEVAMFTSLLFFMRYTQKKELIPELSNTVSDFVAQKFKHVVCLTSPVGETESAVHRVAGVMKQRYPHWHFVNVDTKAVATTMINLLSFLKAEFGLTFKTADKRTVNWLNLDTICTTRRLHVFNQNSHDEAGIARDVEPDFKEMVRRRSDNDWL
jgi:hypothetical protein